MIDWIPIAGLMILGAGLVLGVLFAFFLLCKEGRLKLTLLENRVDIVELFAALELIIVTETDLYEKYLKNNTTSDITSLSNSEFINIYNDLSLKILQSISPNMWKYFELYMTKESIQTHITQRVYNYLAEKVYG